MIRRGFWLLAGAAGGIMGYRRVSSLTRQVSETLGARRDQPRAVPSNTVPSNTAPSHPVPSHLVPSHRARRHWAREAIRFTRDVREGMAQYSARHPRPARPTLNSTHSTDHDEREDH